MDASWRAQKLSYEESLALLRGWEDTPPPGRIWTEIKRHCLWGADEQGQKIWEFRLPLPMPVLPEEVSAWAAYVEALEEEIPSYVMVLFQAGAAAMGYFEEGEVIRHKAFKKYMKRHGQGKSQISYLNTRGKSKAGSRIRLANTVRFFEEINERLTDWEEDFEPERILYSCSAQLWGLLFQSQVPPPFEKKDPRLVKVPKDIKIPTHEELMRTQEFVEQGELRLGPSVREEDFFG
ncbi:MAG: hypothetical protein AAFR61_07230 [Bacteroidota bacterium]